MVSWPETVVLEEKKSVVSVVVHNTLSLKSDLKAWVRERFFRQERLEPFDYNTMGDPSRLVFQLWCFSLQC